MERSYDWIAQSKDDLEHAKLDKEHKFYNWACFSSQQAAEKALKAVFYKMNSEVWGHSISDLIDELSKHYKIDKELKDEALELDKYYAQTRYPNMHTSGYPKIKYTKKEAERSINYATKIIKFCEDILSKI